MNRTSRSVVLLAAVAAASAMGGCATKEPVANPPLNYRRQATVERDKPWAVAKDIDLSGKDASSSDKGGLTQPMAASAAGADPAGQPPDGDAPIVDRTGISLITLPAVGDAVKDAGPWQDAADAVESRIDAPDLKTNFRQGLATLTPRVARALIDYSGETAIVTVAVYRDGKPATQPASATQPAYKHVAVAIAFEGFTGRLDPSFIPRVLADQPRTPDDGREPIDPNLQLDKEASGYLFFRLNKQGLVAGQVPHRVLHEQLLDAVQNRPPTSGPASEPGRSGPMTRPATSPSAFADPSLSPAPLAPEAAAPYTSPPAPAGGYYDDGGYYDPGYDNGSIGRYYGDGYYRSFPYDGYAYGGPSFYGGYYDPYLYDLYGCGWRSPYLIGGGYVGFWGRRHFHDGYRQRPDDNRPSQPDNGGGRGGMVSSPSNRGRVPWSNQPVVPVSATASAASARRGVVVDASPTVATLADVSAGRRAVRGSDAGPNLTGNARVASQAARAAANDQVNNRANTVLGNAPAGGNTVTSGNTVSGPRAIGSVRGGTVNGGDGDAALSTYRVQRSDDAATGGRTAVDRAAAAADRPGNGARSGNADANRNDSAAGRGGTPWLTPAMQSDGAAAAAAAARDRAAAAARGDSGPRNDSGARADPGPRNDPGPRGDMGRNDPGIGGRDIGARSQAPAGDAGPGRAGAGGGDAGARGGGGDGGGRSGGGGGGDGGGRGGGGGGGNGGGGGGGGNGGGGGGRGR